MCQPRWWAEKVREGNNACFFITNSHRIKTSQSPHWPFIESRPARDGVFIPWFWCRTTTPARRKKKWKGALSTPPSDWSPPWHLCQTFWSISISGLLTTVYLCLSVSALYTPQFGNYRVPSYSRRVLFSDSSRWTFNGAIRGRKRPVHIFMFVYMLNKRSVHVSRMRTRWEVQSPRNAFISLSPPFALSTVQLRSLWQYL